MEPRDASLPAIDHFQTFGLPRRFRIDLHDLENRYLALSRVLHPDRFVGRPASEQAASLRHSAALNDSRSILRDPWKRAAYLIAIDGGGAGGEDRRTPPGLVEEMLECREEAAEARAQGNLTKLAAARDAIATREKELLRSLEAKFDRLEAATSEADREAAKKEIRLTLNAGSYISKLLAELGEGVTR